MTSEKYISVEKDISHETYIHQSRCNSTDMILKRIEEIQEQLESIKKEIQSDIKSPNKKDFCLPCYISFNLEDIFIEFFVEFGCEEYLSFDKGTSVQSN